MRFIMVLACLSSLLVGCSCMDQYNPRPYWEKLTKEREIAQRPVPRLTDDGQIPKVESVAQGSEIDQKYATFCSSCHGLTGHADTETAKTLTPHPRNFSDSKWQDSVTDEHIAKVIKEGGAANGLSPMMAPWGGVLADDKIKEMVQKIRHFKGT